MNTFLNRALLFIVLATLYLFCLEIVSENISLHLSMLFHKCCETHRETEKWPLTSSVIMNWFSHLNNLLKKRWVFWSENISKNQRCWHICIIVFITNSQAPASNPLGWKYFWYCLSSAHIFLCTVLLLRSGSIAWQLNIVLKGDQAIDHHIA